MSDLNMDDIDACALYPHKKTVLTPKDGWRYFVVEKALISALAVISTSGFAEKLEEGSNDRHCVPRDEMKKKVTEALQIMYDFLGVDYARRLDNYLERNSVLVEYKRRKDASNGE